MLHLRRSHLVALFSVVVSGLGCAEGDTVPTGSSTGSGGEGPSTSSSGGGGEGTGAMGGGGAGSGGATTSSGGGGEGGVLDKCGNATLDAGEDCDGTELGSNDCTTIGQGFVGGTLACAADCTFDVAGCEAPPNCGNGVIDAGETCDGANLGGATCAAQGLASGSVTCTAGCQLDTSACYQCGNGSVEGPEVCDGTNFAGATCLSLNHDGGTLLCAANCLSLNESSCTDCGDAVVEGTEQCDGNNLASQTCASQGFSSGTLTCSASCTFNYAQCLGQTCNNGVIEGTELCDGTALGVASCVSLGYVGGTLACAGTCDGYVTTSCIGAECQDGTDNDVDGFTDATDPGCTSPTDNDEDVFAPSCNGTGGPIYDISYANTSVDLLVSGTTTGAPNANAPTDFSDDCTTATGSDVVMLYRNTSFKSSITFSLDTLGTNFDTVLYVRVGQCGPGGQEFCNDDYEDLFYSSLQSEMTLLNVPAGDYYIVVDGYGGQGGPFELLIDLPN